MGISMDKWTLAQRVQKGRHVLVLRGVSGAGKSTLAQFLVKALEGAATVVSADDFFVDREGVYRFNGAYLGAAHGECLREFVEVLQGLEDAPDALVIVDNTNTTVAEAAPYMALAAAYNFENTLVDVEAPVEAAAARNVHGVSPEAVEGQGARMAQHEAVMPPFWVRVTLAA